MVDIEVVPELGTILSIRSCIILLLLSCNTQLTTHTLNISWRNCSSLATALVLELDLEHQSASPQLFVSFPRFLSL